MTGMPSAYLRDAFIDEIRRAAARDRNVYFLSADFGAPALDAFRAELPRQFVHTGISEQNLVDLSAGLALSGKRVYAYAMAPFLTLRCLEQIKCALSIMALPVTLVAVGSGLGYAESGATHHATEDFACLRAIAGIEIHTPSDTVSARAVARRTLDEPALRIIRLDRDPLPALYREDETKAFDRGYGIFGAGRICIAACGYMTHRALGVRRRLAREGIDAAVIDVLRARPLDESLAEVFRGHEGIVSIEEQRLAGGFGSAILEFLSDRGVSFPVTRLGLPDSASLGSGRRDAILERCGLDESGICERVRQL